MKLWIDDVRPAPEGYVWCKSVNLAHDIINAFEIIKEAQKEDCFLFPNLDLSNDEIDIIDIDHDAGDYASDGGDYIRLLDWLEETGRNYPIRIHSMNPVGVANMRAIIEKNGWKEIK
jgi:hypothetical protein